MFNIELSEKVLTQKRTIKLIDIFGEIWGIMEFIFTIFSIISSFLTDKLYITSLINNLSFSETALIFEQEIHLKYIFSF